MLLFVINQCITIELRKKIAIFKWLEAYHLIDER